MSSFADRFELMRLIAHLGAASEVELQARTLHSLKELNKDLETLENEGLVERKPGLFKGGFGDALELIREGYRALPVLEKGEGSLCSRAIRNLMECGTEPSDPLRVD